MSETNAEFADRMRVKRGTAPLLPQAMPPEVLLGKIVTRYMKEDPNAHGPSALWHACSDITYDVLAEAGIELETPNKYVVVRELKILAGGKQITLPKGHAILRP